MRRRSILAACLVLGGCQGTFGVLPGSEPAPRPTDRGPDSGEPDPTYDGAMPPPVDPGTDSGTIDPPPPPGTDAGPGPGPEPVTGMHCGAVPPPGATLAPPLPSYSGGSCPTLAAGRNTLRSGGRDREFLLVIPAGYDPATERLPIVVLWHWLGADANSMLSNGAVQESADARRFIAVIPEKAGDLTISIFGTSFDPVWPYLAMTSDARVEQEAVFFDDMIACTGAQYSVDEQCISTGGVSAGALWTSQLMQLRANRIASAIVLSGGTGPATSFGIDVRTWRGASRAVPTLVAWGGAMDDCGLSFNTASQNLESGLTAGGHFILECVHNCGHSAPPIDPAVGLQVLWGFAKDHPFWIPAGQSPYLTEGMPVGMPEWCAIGADSSTPRSGSCPASEACPVGAL
jgi:poly(3-hydroxybutyrate) depolymerase